ncbi:MAG: glutaminase A [Pseudomonadota bacterium]
MSFAIKYLTIIVLIISCLLAVHSDSQNQISDAYINEALEDTYKKFKDLKAGNNADYIPVLAEVDSNIFGVAIVTVDGQVYTVGDIESEVSIQSIAKVFTMAYVMEESGLQAIIDNVGVDATGDVFNSIIAIEKYQGQYMNPFVNPGAIATTSMVKGKSADDIYHKVAAFYDAFAGRTLTLQDDVYISESATNQRNQALASLMFAYGRIKEDPARATDIYTKLGSIGVNTLDLATMAATLANGGVNPITAKKVMRHENIAGVLAVMATAGMYDDAGQWLFKTGLPAKSGVGGGILAVSPGKFGIASISPPLDEAGNSVKGQLAIEAVSNSLNGNPYDVVPINMK